MSITSRPNEHHAIRACVFGAGAVGCHLAAGLARAGEQVSLVARGAALAALRRHGVVVDDGDGDDGGVPTGYPVAAHEHAQDIGPQDLVFIAVKSYDVARTAPQWLPLIRPATLVAFMQNGLPWWFDERRSRASEALAVESVDLAHLIDTDRVVAAVVQFSCRLTAPGQVRNDSPGRNRLLVAEIDSENTARMATVRRLLTRAGFETPEVGDVRKEVWRKLLLNMAGSTLCALTRQDSDVVANNPDIGDLFKRLVREGLAIAEAQGIVFDPGEIVPEAMLARRSAPHRPSMLEDFEHGRPLEIEAILERPRNSARQSGLSTPVLDTVAALIKCLADARVQR